MKGIVVKKTPKGFALEFKELETPKLEKGTAIVKLKAAALNRRDYWISVGKYPNIQEGIVLGSDGCGEVTDGPAEWVGKKVIINPNVNWGENPEYQSGDYSVLGMPVHGTLAEYIRVNTDRLIEKPAYLSDEEASAMPLAGLTAYRALFTKAHISKGQKILVTGIGGGVSQFANAFATAVGAEVYVNSSSDQKIKQAVKSGAWDGFNYKDHEWTRRASKTVGKFDTIIDSAGGNAINDYLRLIKPAGKIVVYGGTTGKTEGLDIFRLFWSQASIIGTTMGNDQEFQEMVEFCRAHKIKPVLAHVYRFEQGLDAIKSMVSPSHSGKVVIRI